MPFEYSCFISYRRENQRNRFIIDFCQHLNTKAKDATNLGKLFLDVEEIKNGVSFPEKIYESIINSCVFFVFNTQHYLNATDYWCAKELYFALKVEDKRKSLLSKDDQKLFNNILILLVNGTLGDLPNSLKTRNAYSIKEFEYFGKFLKTRRSKELLDRIGDRIDEIYKIYNKYAIEEFTNQCKSLEYPKDDEIAKWISIQKTLAKKQESDHKPILIRNAE